MSTSVPSLSFAQDTCEVFGFENVYNLTIEGVSMTETARRVGVSLATLTKWINSNTDRAARMREARRYSSRTWDERAEEMLMAAADPFELSKADKLAHHFRWRASAIAPKEYGAKTDLTIRDETPRAMPDYSHLSEAEMLELRRLMVLAQQPAIDVEAEEPEDE